jgi:hypothetical protein
MWGVGIKENRTADICDDPTLLHFPIRISFATYFSLFALENHLSKFRESNNLIIVSNSEGGLLE